VTTAVQVAADIAGALVITAVIFAAVKALTPRPRTAPEAVEAREEVAA